MNSTRYDAVVAGGSFAGLALATSLRGRVALVEKAEIGSNQTSACATTLDIMRKLGLEEAIEEVHTEGVMHTRRATVRFRLPYDFCTFDYRTFCRSLLARFQGDVVPAAVTGMEGDAVLTSAGPVRGDVLVDATGWRAVLASASDPSFPAHARLTYGLEKPSLGFAHRGLHFYFDRGIRGDGYGWAFPAGGVARAGVLSYVTADGVRASTESFLLDAGMHGGQYHGGYLPAGLRPAVAGPVLVVGDAAGHCLPLTGEGIRPAVFFAQRLAGLLNARLFGEMEMGAVRDAYSELQARFAGRYRWLRRAQRLLRGWPDPPVGTFFKAFRRGFAFDHISQAYWELAAPIEPAARLGTAA